MKYRDTYFDLDDTLYDGTMPWAFAMEKMGKYLQEKYSGTDFSDLQEVKLSVREKVKKINPNSYAFAVRSISFRDILLHYKIDFNWRDIIDLESLYWEFFLDGIQPSQDTVKLIDELSKQYRLYILTDFTMSDQIKRLSKLGLDQYFEDILTAQEVGELKKTGKMFNVALDRYKSDPDKTVMIGDKIGSDIIPARKTGLTTVLVPNKLFPPTEEEKSQADFYFDSVEEVKQLFIN